MKINLMEPFYQNAMSLFFEGLITDKTIIKIDREYEAKKRLFNIYLN